MFYSTLKKQLTNTYQKTQMDIQDLNNTIKQMGHKKQWLDWIDNFGVEIQDKKDVPDNQKRELLNTVLKSILVDYDTTDKVHILTLNFKLPVVLSTENKKGRKVPTQLIYSESTTNNRDQILSVETYSTVVEPFSMTPPNYQLYFSVELRSSNLWLSSYSGYQQVLFDLISKYHTDGWTFKRISDWLNDNGYKTPRGKVFTDSHVWSILMKKTRSINRFSREFEPILTDMKVDTIE